ncbi:MAG: NAD(P)-binding domain-containing protein [bacterium]|nr:NAD(P)-binding domain-containing protein [bacterium]
MKIGIIGSGIVGKALAAGFIKYEYEVMVGSRDPGKLAAWKNEISERLQTGDFAETASFGDIIVLATKGTAAEAAIELAGISSLTGKVVIDTTNPIADAEPVNGVLTFFTGPNRSLLEKLQSLAPEAHFVKAFNSVGSAFMVDPQFGREKPSMFICGNDDAAKKQVHGILDRFGWDIEDMGMMEAARAIEPLCMLWCIPGFRENRWTHAFKLLKL